MIVNVEEVGEVMSKRRAQGRAVREGIMGYRPTGGVGRGTERELECLLEVGDVVRREGTKTGLIGGRWSWGKVCKEGRE